MKSLDSKKVVFLDRERLNGVGLAKRNDMDSSIEYGYSIFWCRGNDTLE